MKITKFRLKQIIKEELMESMFDSDEDGIPDAKELAVIDRGELSPTLDEVIAQLYDLRKQHKAKEQWEVARYIDEAIDRLQHAISSMPKEVRESTRPVSHGTGWGPKEKMDGLGVEKAFSDVGIHGMHAGLAEEVIEAYDKSAITSAHDQMNDLEKKLGHLSQFERSTTYAAVGAILKELNQEDNFI